MHIQTHILVIPAPQNILLHSHQSTEPFCPNPTLLKSPAASHPPQDTLIHLFPLVLNNRCSFSVPHYDSAPYLPCVSTISRSYLWSVSCSILHPPCLWVYMVGQAAMIVTAIYWTTALCPGSVTFSHWFSEKLRNGNYYSHFTNSNYYDEMNTIMCQAMYHMSANSFSPWFNMRSKYFV